MIAYSADRIPEIADDIVTIDRAMRWGYNWDLGPFEICDALGPAYVAKRLEKEGRAVPKLLARTPFLGKEDLLRDAAIANRCTSILGKRAAIPVPPAGGRIDLKLLRQEGKVVHSNSGASLIDLGDGVACVEFHAKMNVIGGDQVGMIRESLDIVRQKFEGLVIGNQAEHFSAGANLMLLLSRIQNEEWDEVELMVRTFQDANMSLRAFEKPVVIACHGYTLGGGCEMSMKADYVMLAAETYLGLPEVGVGVIPGGGGTSEMLIRSTEGIKSNDVSDYLPALGRAFETIGFGKVGTSAHEALRYGYLRPSQTTIHVQGERRLDAAKAKVLELAAQGYVAPQPRTDIPAVGIEGLSAIRLQLHLMQRGGLHFRARQADRLKTRLHSHRWRPERPPARFRTVHSRSRAGSIPVAVRRTEDDRTHSAHAQDRQTAPQLIRKNHERSIHCIGGSYPDGQGRSGKPANRAS